MVLAFLMYGGTKADLLSNHTNPGFTHSSLNSFNSGYQYERNMNC